MAILPPIRGVIKYLAEIFRVDEFDPRLAIADAVFDRSYNIYAFSVAPRITDPANYWIQWGGWFDNPVGYGFTVYMQLFLSEVFTTALLITTENSFYIDRVNDILYMNIPYKPWQYFDAFSNLYSNNGLVFTNAPKNTAMPSDMYYGAVKVLARMEVPSLSNKLNDVISGIVLYNDFTIQIDNSDGLYDGINIIDYFNTPIQISKHVGDTDSIEDFNRIRMGLVDDLGVTSDQMQVKGVDQTYRMNKDFCRKFSKDEYPNLDDSDVNTDIPVAWGSVIGVGIVEVNKSTASPPTWIDYIAIDPNYITACSALYDGDGNSLTFTFYPATGIIRATQLDDGEVIEADSADVTGKADSRIGQIIIEALAGNENIPYVTGVWDVDETNLYLALCASVGFYFEGGTTKELVEAVLKNDNAFLIQKNNGMLTLRQWGQEYDVHDISSWMITEKPKKNFKDASKYYCSSVEIRSHKNNSSNNYTQTYINESREAEIFEKYKRSYLAPFETDLLSDVDIEDLASRLLQRFGTVRETLQIGYAVDTFQVNLLDTVVSTIQINDRLFSDYQYWIVKECDPAQDTMTLEGIKEIFILSFDGDYATLDGDLWEVTSVSI